MGDPKLDSFQTPSLFFLIIADIVVSTTHDVLAKGRIGAAPDNYSNIRQVSVRRVRRNGCDMLCAAAGLGQEPHASDESGPWGAEALVGFSPHGGGQERGSVHSLQRTLGRTPKAVSLHWIQTWHLHYSLRQLFWEGRIPSELFREGRHWHGGWLLRCIRRLPRRGRPDSHDIRRKSPGRSEKELQKCF